MTNQTSILDRVGRDTSRVPREDRPTPISHSPPRCFMRVSRRPCWHARKRNAWAAPDGKGAQAVKRPGGLGSDYCTCRRWTQGTLEPVRRIARTTVHPSCVVYRTQDWYQSATLPVAGLPQSAWRNSITLVSDRHAIQTQETKVYCTLRGLGLVGRLREPGLMPQQHR